MKFRYKARNKEGELQAGVVDAQNRPGALALLSSHGLFVLAVEEVGAKPWYDSISKFLNRVKTKDILIFTRQFAAILQAQIPMNSALLTLQKQTANPILKDAVHEISLDVDAGLSLSQAIEKHNEIFSTFYVNMIRSAELTGRVQEAVGFLADYIDRQSLLVSKVKNALIYPAIMAVLFACVGVLMATLVLPKIEPVFKESGVVLPLFSRIVFGAAKFFEEWWWIVIIIIVALVTLLIDYFKSHEGRNTLDEIMMRLPVLGQLFRKVYITRLSESIGVLVKGGIPIPQAVEVAGYTVGSVIYQEILHEAAEGIRRGELLSQALSKDPDYFPPLVIQMIAVGETTGQLEEMLGRVAVFYTREVNDLVGNLVELIQPLMMVFIGLAVGGLFASILIPIFQLAQKI